MKYFTYNLLVECQAVATCVCDKAEQPAEMDRIIFRPCYVIIVLIAPLSDIPMFYIKYLTMHMMQ